MNQLSLRLNQITIYRLMLYYLIFLNLTAFTLSLLNVLPYRPMDLILSASIIISSCYLSNQLFGRLFKVPTNLESQFITGFILILIVNPISPISNYLFLTSVSILAMWSKYVFVARWRHIFNPATAGVVLTALFMNQGASWWVGRVEMLPFVLLGGVLMTKRMRNWGMVISFLCTYLGFFTLVMLYKGQVDEIFTILLTALKGSAIIFFVFVMLVEPLTSPTTSRLKIIYGALVGMLLVAYQNFFPSVSSTLELALLSGNIFARMTNSHPKSFLKLLRIEPLASNTFGFWFEPSSKIRNIPGQFLEWTLPHAKPDSRGIRRYFTMASSPTEDMVLLATRIIPENSTDKKMFSSSFKKALHSMKVGDEIIVSEPKGEFVLTTDPDRKIALIAGGIGITPFRAIVKWLVDGKISRDIILLYSNKSPEDIAFKELFDEGVKSAGLRVVYKNTDATGFIDEKFIKSEVPDHQDRLFFISGPEPMVEAMTKILQGMNISKSNIKQDFFPGYSETH